MKTDRELLELAAKVAGYVITGWNNRNSTTVAVLSDGSYWQPLLKNQITDTDGDALRLAIDLNLQIRTSARCDFSSAGYAVNDIRMDYVHENHGSDKHSSVRRAIVRAAAAIGESMRD